MNPYTLPQIRPVQKRAKSQIQLIANGDLRLTANQKCWPEQARMEETLRKVIDVVIGDDLLLGDGEDDAGAAGSPATPKPGAGGGGAADAGAAEKERQAQIQANRERMLKAQQKR